MLGEDMLAQARHIVTRRAARHRSYAGPAFAAESSAWIPFFRDLSEMMDFGEIIQKQLVKQGASPDA